MRGALWMLLSAVAFTAMTTLVKFLGADYAAPLQAFYRQAASFVVLLPLILRNPRAAFTTRRPGILIFRSVAGAVGLILSFYAFQTMPLAEANALSFTRALWLVPLATLFLREPIGPHRWGASIVGFIGVMVMLHPSGGGHWAGAPQLAMLVSAFLFALTVTGMKSLSRDHSPETLLYWSAALGFVLVIPGAFWTWKTPGPRDLALLSLIGVIATVSQYSYIKSMASADATAMAPIEYTRLIFAALTGYFLFREIPDPLALAGAAIVIGSTLYITWREYMLARPLFTA